MPVTTPYLDGLLELMQQSKLGGTVVNNLMWRPFSDTLERLFEAQRGPLVTVHPLGGCAMGDDVRQGVTDHCGRVFDPDGPDRQSVHEGLVVLDGSIVPTSLGINPSLTISVLALRAIMQLKTEWKLRDTKPSPPVSALERPIYATPDPIANPKPTRIELTEQVRGRVTLRTPQGKRRSHHVQITLTTEPAALNKLFACEANGQRSLSIAPGKGTLTILKAGRDFDAVSDQPRREDIALEASISGQLRLFEFAPSNRIFRTARASWAWFRNRGLRDVVQDGLQWLQTNAAFAPASGTGRTEAAARAQDMAVCQRNRIGLFARRRRPPDQLRSDDRRGDLKSGLRCLAFQEPARSSSQAPHLPSSRQPLYTAPGNVG